MSSSKRKSQGPSAPSSQSRNRRSIPGEWIPGPDEWSHVRWIALILAIGMLAGSVVLRINPELLPKGSALASELFGKVGVVLFCVWLAWPALMSLLRVPSGVALAMAGVFAVGLFIYKAKTIYITGPFLIVAAAMAFLMAWIRSNQPRR